MLSLLKNEKAAFISFITLLVLMPFEHQILLSPLYNTLALLFIFAVIMYSAVNVAHHAEMLAENGCHTSANWHIELDYHFGGYAKTTPRLFRFIKQFKKDYGITLDAVYTGKMFYGLFDQIRRGIFEKGTRIIAVHSGGVQGNAGFPELDGL